MFRLSLIGFFILFGLAMIEPSGGNKYSSNKNSPGDGSPLSSRPENEAPFRMNRINIVWQKAKKKELLDPLRLDALFLALKSHDQKELDHKHGKMRPGYDQDGEIAAALRQSFNRIVLEFDLKEKLVEALTPGSKKFSAKEFNEVSPGEKTSASFADPKVDKLWKLAAKSGFDENELEALKVELRHHQEKQDQLNLLLKDDDDFSVSNEIPQGDAPPHKYQENSEHTQMLKKREVRDKKEELKENWDRINEKIGGSGFQFKEPRVLEFWLRAEKANFTAEELHSLKEELAHFQKKLEKHEWVRDQADSIENDHKDGKSVDHVQHGNMRRRQKELEQKIQKLESHLEERIGSRDLGEL